MGHLIVGRLLSQWRDLRVLIAGDAILDVWLASAPQRLCREAPVPVVAVEQADHFCGGAANTAANVAALGATVTLVAPVGADDGGARMRDCLTRAGVRPALVETSACATPSKRRLMAGDQIIARLDEGGFSPLPDDTAQALLRRLDAELAEGVDAVVICDYGMGAVDERVAQWITEHRERIPLLVVDAHRPQRWAATAPDLVTPSFAEIAGLLGDTDGDTAGDTDRAAVVTARRDRLKRRLPARITAVTLDVDGVVVLEDGAPPYRTHATPLPEQHSSGAGDAYTAAFTLALATGAPTGTAAEVAQLAATAAIQRPSTAVCDAATLVELASDAEQREIDAGALAQVVAAHRAHGRRVVFTNGCFDVLHRGHVGYLNQAKRQGDVLIVAVNSDESVRRLKGPQRPINPVADRVAVLAALSCVDHVVVFEADSPADLIELVRPDVYVKGGDYRPELIPEASLVLRLGGEVRVLDYLPDRSTSEIIDRIRAGYTALHSPHVTAKAG